MGRWTGPPPDLHTYLVVDLYGVGVDVRCVQHLYTSSFYAHAPNNQYSVAFCKAHVRIICDSRSLSSSERKREGDVWVGVSNGWLECY